MFGRSVSFEQADSLITAVQEAGHEHGDTGEVEFEGVGVVNYGGVPHLAFCPARVSAYDTVARGTPVERRQKMPTTVVLTRGARRQIRRQLSDFNGFATVRCSIHSNGKVRVSNIEILQTNPWHGRIASRDAYREYLALSAGT